MILAALAALLLTLTLTSTAPAAEGSAEPTVVHYEPEGFKAYEAQLAHAEIRAVTFNKKAHTMHVTLVNGRHALVKYPSHEEPTLAAALEAKGVAVTVKKHAKKTAAVHHTLRYIAGGILVLVILAILIVLLVGRRRTLAVKEGSGGADPVKDGSG
jgi:hypothetical protein